MIGIIPIIIAIVITIAIITLAERKIMGSSQRRIGPNKVGVMGILQPIADGVKLIASESIVPSQSNTIIFIISPIIVFACSLLSYIVIPWNKSTIIPIVIDNNILYLLALSSLSIWGVLYAGISANSKYAIYGALRSTAQLISYEIIIGIIIITIVILSTDPINSSLNLSQIVYSQKAIKYFIPHLPLFIIWLISILAETNRTPMDLPEAESELVAGFHTEHSSLPFAYFYLGEYSNIILMSILTYLIFLGGLNKNIDIIKIIIIIKFFIWTRSSLPRIKYTQLISLCWIKCLPIILGYLILVISIINIIT